jgi:HEAT repeat protein
MIAMHSKYKIFVDAIQRNDAKERRDAAVALSSLSISIFPSLIHILRSGAAIYYEHNDLLPTEITLSLGRMLYPERTVPALAELLKEKCHPLARKEAAKALRILGTNAKETVPLLLKSLADHDCRMRRDCVLALGAVGDSSLPVIHSLITLLTDNEPEVRAFSARALGMLKTLNRQALSALAKTSKDHDIRVRIQADAANAAIRQNVITTVPKLLEVLRNHPEEDVRLHSALALRILPLESDVVPALIEKLQTSAETASVKSELALVLRSIGPAAQSATRCLVTLLQDHSILVRSCALDALRFINPPPAEVLPSFISSLRSDEARVRELAALAIQALGSQASSATSALRTVLKKDDNPAIRIRAIVALAAMGQHDQATINSLTHTLSDRYSEVRLIAASMLSGIAPVVHIATVALIDLLNDEDLWVREEAERVLESLGSTAISALVKAVQNNPRKNASRTRHSDLNSNMRSHERPEPAVFDKSWQGTLPRTAQKMVDKANQLYIKKLNNMGAVHIWEPEDAGCEPKVKSRMHKQITENDVIKAQMSFDRQIDKVLTEKNRHAVQLTPVLNDYLDSWARHQQMLTDKSNKTRSADEIAQAKHALAEHVSGRLSSAGLAIAFDGQATALMAGSGGKNRYGYFLLMPKSPRTPLIKRSEMTDLLRDASGKSNRSPGLNLMPAPLRREGLSEWRERARTPSPPRNVQGR